MEYGNLAYKLPEQYDEPIKKRKPQKRKEKTVNTTAVSNKRNHEQMQYKRTILAIGHVKAIEHCSDKEGVHIYNLGTGNGYSVLDIVKAFSKACGKEIPYQIDPRRPGDIAECYADPAKAKAELGWEAKRGIDEMCADSWRWQSTHPDGFGE